MVPLAHPSPQRYGITMQTWRIIIIIPPCLHSYTITLYLVTQRYIIRRHYFSPHHPVVPTQLYHNVFTARRSYASAVLEVVILSVCPSVCHTRTL